MRMLGRILFASSFVLLGVLGLCWPGLFQGWEPLPKWFVWKEAYAIVAGSIMVIGGVGILIPRTMRPAALLLTVFLAIETVALYARHIFLQPLVEVIYESLGQALIYIAGAWTIYATSEPPAKFANVRAAQILFGLALLPIGLSHFFYMNLTAPLIPSWLPYHVPLGYFTGACHFAAGLGVLFGIRLAATLEAVMVSLFTLLVWVPRLIEAPQTQGNWSEFCASAIISGAAFIVAGSFSREPRTE